MATKIKDWQALVKGLLKAELKRRNLSYADLAENSGLSVSRITTGTSQTRLRGALSRPSFSYNAWKPSAVIPSTSKIPEAGKQTCAP
jgi:hypothetical protein